MNDNAPTRGWQIVPFDDAQPDGLKVSQKSARDFLFPDAHRQYTPYLDAYVERRDLPELFRLIEQEKRPPAEAVARFDYLTPADRAFAARALIEGFRVMEAQGHLDRWPHLKGL